VKEFKRQINSPKYRRKRRESGSRVGEKKEQVNTPKNLATIFSGKNEKRW